MAETTQRGSGCAETAGESVCIHTKKIFDSCRDKDCITDLRFYPTNASQTVLDQALSVRAGSATILSAFVDVNPVGVNRGFYSVDVRYFYRITADAFVGAGRPVEITGLAIFDKRAILFGSESGAKIFSSAQGADTSRDPCCFKSNYPTAIVEAVDPIVLNLRLTDPCDRCGCDCSVADVPGSIAACFPGELSFSPCSRRLYISLGQFSIIRLERDVQLQIPAYSYCMPDKECTGGGTDSDPCAVFSQVSFPVDEFFPPSVIGSPDSYRDAAARCGC